MVSLFIWTFTILPPALAWLGPALSLIGTFLFWLAAALVLRVVLGTARHWLTRRTDTENDQGPGLALEFFIDDIELEHFERRERVRRELEMEIVGGRAAGCWTRTGRGTVCEK